MLRDNLGMERAVVRDPQVMHGVPVFRETRVPVQTLFDYLEGGESLEDFLTGFPTVSRELAAVDRNIPHQQSFDSRRPLRTDQSGNRLKGIDTRVHRCVESDPPRPDRQNRS